MDRSGKPDPSSPGRQDAAQDEAFLARELGRIQDALARLEALPALGAALSEHSERISRQLAENVREQQALREAVASLKDKVEALHTTLSATPPLRGHVPEPEKRVGIFVDVQNVFYGAKSVGARLDFGRLLEVSAGSRRLVRAITYVVTSPDVDQSAFLSMLQQKGYEIRSKELRTRADGSAKGDWDMGMAIDIMSLVDRLDVVVLVTGDGDFVSLVNLVKTIGPRVELVSFQHNTARDLIESVDHYTPVEASLLLAPSPGRQRKSPESAPSSGSRLDGPE